MHPETLLYPRRPYNGCDYVIRGEAEESICQLIEMLDGRRGKEEVSGLVSKDSGHNKLLFSKNLTVTASEDRSYKMKKGTLLNTSYPKFSGLRQKDYHFQGRPMSFLITSRSCPHQCTFCSIHSVFGYTYRTRSANDILGEIRQRYHQGIRHFDIEDDNFTVNKKAVSNLLDQLISLKLPITFSAMNGLSYISLDAPLLEKMRTAGFSSLNLALVSSDKIVQEFSKRPHTVKKFYEITRIAAKLNFRVTAYFILGMPGQTLRDIWNTLKILAESKCLIGASPFYFTPGSPIHKKEIDNPAHRLESNNGGDPYFSARLTTMDLESSTFQRDDIYTLFRFTRVINYAKKGIDSGYDAEGSFFSLIKDILLTKKWDAKTKDSVNPMPFSPKIAAFIDEAPLKITGYKNSVSYLWEPKKSRFSTGKQSATPGQANLV